MRVIRSLVCLAAAASAAAQTPAKPLVERLGFPPGTKVLLMNADDAGILHAENVATIDALKRGLVGSATVMTPAPWFPEFASMVKAHPEFDIGVHLTFTSEWTGYRFGPILGTAGAPSLVDSSGFFHLSLASMYAKATVDEAEAEGRAQIKRALDAGIDVSHLDMHMHALGLDARFFDVYLKLAREFDLPVRFIPPNEDVRRAQATRLRQAGIIFQDYVIVGADQEPGETLPVYWRRKIRQLAPGVVTELYIHVSQDDPELRAMTGDQPFRTGWRDRVAEYRIFTDPAMKRLVDSAGVKLIHWKDLRALQRKEQGK